MTDHAATIRDVLLAPGTMVGEYRVERLIGQGTFGDVYAAEHPLIGKKAAVKLLREDSSSQPDVVARFTAEARAVNLIKNRHIVDVFSFGMLAERRHYLVMELLSGLTLGELLDTQTRLDATEALPILRGIADALDAAHRAGVVHRDLKPDNVFLVPEADGGYSPRLLDFGVAKLCPDEIGIKTATGVAIGTPRYMSPEQCRGKHVDHRTDIYALGAMIHQMLTGEPPFDADSPTALLVKQTVEPPPAMSSVCAAVAPALDAPVLAMLAKRPADRPASAGNAVAMLAAALEDLARPRSTSDTLPLGSRITAPPPSVPIATGQPVTVRLPDVGTAAPAISVTLCSEAPAPQVVGLAPRPPASREGTSPVSSASSASVKIPMSGVGPAPWIVWGMAVAAIGVGAAVLLRSREAATPPSLIAEGALSSQPTVIRVATTAVPATSAVPDTPAPSAVSVTPNVSASRPPAPPPSAAQSRSPGRPDHVPRPTAASRPPAHDIGF